ncbi:MAG TPA: hypothetical protein PLC67_08820 [Spirochaetota bacterium]|nr:hypothetical protein [Spirochaetota bacterium]
MSYNKWCIHHTADSLHDSIGDVLGRKDVGAEMTPKDESLLNRKTLAVKN